MLAHLLKYDSAQGRYGKEVTHRDDAIVVDGTAITVYSEREPQNLPWGRLNVDVVLECTGFFASKKAATTHIEAGARKVVISAPADGDLPTIVFGVNEHILQASDTIISAASCTPIAWRPWPKR